MKLGVIGTGTMGGGIAEQAAIRGHQVALVKYTGDDTSKARKSLESNLRKRTSRENNLPLLEVMLERVKVTTELADVADCDIVVEAIAETVEAKTKLLSELGEVLSATSVVGMNTSTIPINQMAAAYKYPSMLIGTHFMNPVPGNAVKGAEIILHPTVSKAALAAAIDLMEGMDKIYSFAPDTAGFTVNRVLFALIAAGIMVFEESGQTIMVTDIDSVMKNSANHPMGPLELADLVGLDITLSIIEILREHHAKKALPVPALLSLMVAKGQLGRKSGQGFYDYGTKEKPTQKPRTLEEIKTPG